MNPENVFKIQGLESQKKWGIQWCTSMAYLKLLRPRNHHQVWGQAKLTFELRTLLNILLLLLLIIDFTERSALLDPKLGDDF